MHKIAVIGDKNSVLGFKAIGISIYPTEAAGEAAELVRQLAGEYSVIFIIEKLASEISPILESCSTLKYPVIVPIPGVSGTMGMGMEGLRKCVEKAVGADILFNNE